MGRLRYVKSECRNICRQGVKVVKGIYYKVNGVKMDVGKNGPDMGPKHAPPFESKSESIWTKD